MQLTVILPLLLGLKLLKVVVLVGKGSLPLCDMDLWQWQRQLGLLDLSCKATMEPWPAQWLQAHSQVEPY